MSNGATEYAASREVRFAVVMYGGVSLAIYINGVTQELLRMVQATAPKKDKDGSELGEALLADGELNGSARVYRKLGQMLRDGQVCTGSQDDAIHTRFIVDVISGTSAGGINGLFLGKALANDQSLDELKGLWKDEGEIAKLLNDQGSIADLDGYRVQHPPQSLLNSQRMYRKLLDAFDGMGGREAGFSPLVEELDLFITTTDIRGRVLPIKLADKVVDESRFRSVFHFRYATPEAAGEAEIPENADVRNDFVFGNNPFLAYAARCTSSFPFAFEPMRLCDVDAVLNAHPDHRNWKDAAGQWKKFYSEYQSEGNEFRNRAFGDGGYLDNKPFTYATSMLTQRRANVPVERKLFYIEPAPEALEASDGPVEKPDVIKNVTAALLDLPRYETIREDIDRLMERNRLLERIRLLTMRVDDDVEAHENAVQRQAEQKQQVPLRMSGEEYAKLDLAAMIGREGVAYGAYHRLKVSEITSDLAALMTRLSGLDVHSDDCRAIELLVKGWREKNYVEYHADRERIGNKDAATENRFVLDFDLHYRMRRLNFIGKRISEVYGLVDQSADGIFTAAGVTFRPGTADEAKAFRKELREIQKSLSTILVKLRDSRQKLNTDPDLRKWVKTLMNDLSQDPTTVSAEARRDFSKLLRDLLGQPVQQRSEEVHGILAAHAANISGFARQVSEGFRKVMMAADEKCRQVFDPSPSKAGSAASGAACSIVKYFYSSYEHYDMIIFPIMHGSGASEANSVEVFRISPLDATNITKQPKLAGTALGNFGAFLDQGWRENDMLWGRLDGAERIIQALMPPGAKRDELITEAQRAIVAEDYEPKNPEMVNALRQALEKASTQNRAEIVKWIADEKWNDLNTKWELDRTLQAESSVRSMARSARITGAMLEGLARSRRWNQKPFAIAARLTRLFWGLVEVAIPHSIPELIFRYWLQLIYLFDLLCIVGGILGSKSDITLFGWSALAITAAANLCVFTLNSVMRSRHGFLLAIKIAIGLIMLALLVAGFLHLSQDSVRLKLLQFLPEYVAGAAVYVIGFTLRGAYLRASRQSQFWTRIVAGIFAGIFLILGVFWHESLVSGWGALRQHLLLKIPAKQAQSASAVSQF